MKKVIALFLTVILAISCSAVSASADTAKIGETLQSVMDDTPDNEKIEVHIWLYCKVDKAEAHRQAVKECGYIGGLPLNMTLDEVYAFKDVFNRIISEQEAAVSSFFVDKLGIAEEDIVYLGKHPYVVARITKEQICEASAFPEVESLSYADGVYIEPTAKSYTKISESLQRIMELAPDDEKIEVHIWLHSKVDKEAAHRQALKECGYIGGLPLNMTLDEVYAYKEVYNRIISEQEAAVSSSFVEKLGVSDEDIVYLGKHPYIIVDLTKDKIREADTYAEVESIDFADSVPADLDPAEDNSPLLFEDKVKETHPFLYDYSELYYHNDSNGAVDWVLIKGDEEAVVPEPVYQVIGNRVIIQSEWTAPFGFGIGVYNVSQNTVTSVYDGILEQYDGLEEAFNKYGCGKLIGDVDGDGSISILDATVIQRCLAELRDFPAGDLIETCGVVDGALMYYSDFNRDGGRDIFDATSIQRYLVGLD